MTEQLDFVGTLETRSEPADTSKHVCGDCRYHLPTGASFNGSPSFHCTNPKGYGGGIRADFPITAHGWSCWEVRA